MKTIFNEADKNELLQRIEKLTPQSNPLWGKMNVAQMLAHCAKGSGMPIGDTITTLTPLRFIGQFFKKSLLGEKPFGKNSPTAKELIITDERDFQKEKTNAIAAINKLYRAGEKGVTAKIHPFFNKVTPQEWGQLNYKHTDHHLQQFGA